MFFALRARSRWNGYVNALRAEPGVVVVSTGRAAGKYVVTGLRDPLASDPASLLPSHNLGPDAVESRWELYQALHPSIVHRPCPPAPGASRRREPRVQGWRASRGGIGAGRMD